MTNPPDLKMPLKSGGYSAVLSVAREMVGRGLMYKCVTRPHLVLRLRLVYGAYLLDLAVSLGAPVSCCGHEMRLLEQRSSHDAGRTGALVKVTLARATEALVRTEASLGLRGAGPRTTGARPVAPGSCPKAESVTSASRAQHGLAESALPLTRNPPAPPDRDIAAS
jgi:hypothetical protein